MAPSFPSEIVIAISSTGAVIVSSNSGEFSSGQIESVTHASSTPPMPDCDGHLFRNTAVTGFIHWPAVNQHSETVEVSGCFISLFMSCTATLCGK